MTKVSRVAALLACLPVIAAGAPRQGPVQVDGGRVEGEGAGTLTVYKAIPFAAAPVGELRWRAPAPVAPWSGVRRAAPFAPACMQTGVSMPGETPPKMSEDCLYLNIWTPATSAGRRRAVLVFIHGGGFSNGSASMPLYWGDELARHDVIVVTFGYRLGPFGFLSLPELTAESGGHGSGNYGLLDQIAALNWMKRNIAAFGGDPDRVTIFGQSAGSMSVSLLMATPLARGLFERAIGESGGVFEPLQLAPDWLLAGAQRRGEAYAASLGAASLAELRALPAARLLGGKAPTITHPVIDGFTLAASPFEIFSEGRQNDVPLLIGFNDAEARSLVDLSVVRAATFDADIRSAFGPLPPALMAAYPHATDPQAKQARADFERDLRFGWDMWTWARLQAAKGSAPVYYYHFTQAPPFPPGSVYAGWGASHYAELWYAFGHLGQDPWAWTNDDQALSKAMTTYWTNFAKSGDPNGPSVPTWPVFSKERGQTLYLGTPIAVGGAPDANSLAVFDAVYSRVRGDAKTQADGAVGHGDK